MKLQRNALSVLEAPTGNEEDDNDDMDCDNSFCSSSDMGDKDMEYCKSIVFSLTNCPVQFLLASNINGGPLTMPSLIVFVIS